MPFRRFILFFLLFIIQVAAYTQLPEEIAFREAYYRGDAGNARLQFLQLFRRDSVQAIRFAEEAEDLFLQNPNDLRSDWLDVMVRIFHGAADADKERGFEWRVKHANLVLAHPEFYASVTAQTLRECFERYPNTMPLHQLEAWAAVLMETRSIRDMNLENFLEDWVRIDRAMMERAVLHPEESRDMDALQRELYSSVRKTVPDCGEMHKQNAIWFRQPSTTSRTVKTTFSVMCMHECSGAFLLDTVWPRMSRFAESPYWMRKAASQAMNAGEYSMCHQLLQEARSAEKDPRLQAMDLVNESRVFSAEKKFRDAWKLLEQAVNLHPSWGQPYVEMADLMVVAMQDCGYTAFDKKAVYWAAIDYCALAKNADPTWETEANHRIYDYAQKAPLPSEIAQRDLKVGDTYPLHCWLELVTTVKVF